MSEHTKEPWAIKYRNGFFQIIDAKGEVVADDGSSADEYAPTMTEDTARRIVACVNAWAGTDTEILEKEGVGYFYREWSKERFRAEAAEAKLEEGRKLAKDSYEAACKFREERDDLQAALDRVRSITVEAMATAYWEAPAEAIDMKGIKAIHRLLTERMGGE